MKIDREDGAEWQLRQWGIPSFIHNCESKQGLIVLWDEWDLPGLFDHLRAVWDPRMMNNRK